MSKEARIESLTRKHRELERVIEALEGERAPDMFIHQKKKEKLALKDELYKLKDNQ